MLHYATAHRVYLDAVESAFGSEIDYAMLVKLYGNDRKRKHANSPAECIGCKEIRIIWKSRSETHLHRLCRVAELVSSHAMRRYTRLSNGFFRKIQNHAAAAALNYFAYNFIKIHRTPRVSPAMAAGVTEHSSPTCLSFSYEAGPLPQRSGLVC